MQGRLRALASPETRCCVMMVCSSSYQQYWQRPECHGEMPTRAGNQPHSHNHTLDPDVLGAALTYKIGRDHNRIRSLLDQ